MKPVRLAVLAATMAVGALHSSQAASIYRWVDGEGIVNYGSVPPEAGPAAKTVRAVSGEPAVAAHETSDERQARRALSEEAQRAEEARLRRQLLSEQIDAERARAELLRAQAAATQTTGANCPADASCEDDGYAVPIVRGYGRAFLPHFHPRPSLRSTSVRSTPLGSSGRPL